MNATKYVEVTISDELVPARVPTDSCRRNLKEGCQSRFRRDPAGTQARRIHYMSEGRSEIKARDKRCDACDSLLALSYSACVDLSCIQAAIAIEFEPNQRGA